MDVAIEAGASDIMEDDSSMMVPAWRLHAHHTAAAATGSLQHASLVHCITGCFTQVYSELADFVSVRDAIEVIAC